MTDAIPTQAWLLLLLAMMAVGPAVYVWRHVAQGLVLPDITQPPRDVGWRSTKKLYRSLGTLLVIVAAGVVTITPWTRDFVNSERFLPSLAGAFPHSATPRCDDYTDDRDKLAEALATCNVLLSEASTDPGSRADLLHDRGRVHHRLGNDDRALADYTASLEIDPDNSYALFNRGLIHARVRNLAGAIEDFSVSLALRPDNDDAYFERGLVYLDSWRLHEAVADLTILHRRDPDHEYALATRGLAYAWLNDATRAEADFGTVSAGEPAWPVVLRGRAVLAERRRDYRSAIAFLTEALRIDPNDEFSLQHRADAYWEIGQLDLARDDDDRLTALRPPSQPIFVAPNIAVSSEGTVLEVSRLPPTDTTNRSSRSISGD